MGVLHGGRQDTRFWARTSGIRWLDMVWEGVRRLCLFCGFGKLHSILGYLPPMWGSSMPRSWSSRRLVSLQHFAWTLVLLMDLHCLQSLPVHVAFPKRQAGHLRDQWPSMNENPRSHSGLLPPETCHVAFRNPLAPVLAATFPAWWVMVAFALTFTRRRCTPRIRDGCAVRNGPCWP